MEFDQVDAIIDNFKQRSKDIKDANREIARVEKILRKQSPKGVVNPRHILQGPKGGLYYRDQKDKKIYLSPSQCHSCENNILGNVASGCPPPNIGGCQPTRGELKQRLLRSEKKRKTLKRKLQIQKRRRKTCKEKLRVLRSF